MRSKVIASAFVAVTFFGLIGTNLAVADESARYYVVFNDFGPRSARAIESAGGRAITELPQLSAISAELDTGARDRLLRDPRVADIEIDPKRFPMATERSPYGIGMVQADQVSDANASAIKICIIDSGYYAAHEDLQDASPSVTGANDPGTGNWFEDWSGHGTHVAGTISAVQNALGVVGVIRSGLASMHIVKVFGDDGTWAYSSSLVAALSECRDAGAKVVNMSLGGGARSRVEENAFKSALEAGVLSIAAAGNGGNNATHYPAGYRSVVSVAAIDSNGDVASFSQRNKDVELAAPGVAVESTVPWTDTSALTAGVSTYSGSHIDGSGETTATTAELANGGLCEAGNPAWTGKIVLCQRGSITFLEKVTNVEASGGVGVAIYNNVEGSFGGSLGDGSSSVPAISLSKADGEAALAWVGTPGTLVSEVVQPSSGYDFFSGTSMAAPHVSAVAALVWSHNPSWTPGEVRDALNTTATDLGRTGRDTSYGYGLVQAKAALDYLLTP